MHYLPRKNRRIIKNRKNFDALPVYREFLENTSEFQKLHDMPVDLPFPEVSVQMLFEKNSSWYHVCHQMFTKSCFEKAKTKQKKKPLTKV